VSTDPDHESCSSHTIFWTRDVPLRSHCTAHRVAAPTRDLPLPIPWPLAVLCRGVHDFRGRRSDLHPWALPCVRFTANRWHSLVLLVFCILRILGRALSSLYIVFKFFQALSPHHTFKQSRSLPKNLIKMYKTVILPVVLYGCDTSSLTPREGHILRVSENRVLRRIFGPGSGGRIEKTAQRGAS